MTAEEQFKRALRDIIAEGRVPTPTAVRLRLGRPAQSRDVGGPTLNGRECAWRREVFEEAGATKSTVTGRWSLAAPIVTDRPTASTEWLDTTKEEDVTMTDPDATYLGDGWEAEPGANSPALHHFYFDIVDTDGDASELHFQDGPVRERGENGVTNEHVIGALIARLGSLNELMPCRENSLAITKLEEALHWLLARRSSRRSRGVLGTSQA